MKVFLSWSGTASRAVAEALHEWLPNVLQEVKPWHSAVDLTPGVRWLLGIGRELEQASFGVLCLTRSNLAAPWILFEAGALGKTLETSRVMPFLYNVPTEQVVGPLSQFQSVEADVDGTRALVSAIYGSIQAPSLSPERLNRAFGKWWPELESHLSRIPTEEDQSPTQATRTQSDVLAEVLAIVRGLQRDAQMASAIVDRTSAKATRAGEIARAEKIHRIFRIALEARVRSTELLDQVEAALQSADSSLDSAGVGMVDTLARSIIVQGRISRREVYDKTSAADMVDMEGSSWLDRSSID